MDQTEPENRVFSRYQQERRADSNMGGDVLLPTSDLYQIPDKIWLFTATVKPGDQRDAVCKEKLN